MSDLKIFAKTIENEAIEQIDALVSLDAFKNSKVRIMPDVHVGSGCVIGFTADLGDKVIPNIVGVDIGCGMLCIKLKDVKDVDFEKLENVINTFIPSGMTWHNKGCEQYKKNLEICKEILDEYYEVED
jgi:tRNA-splicing ligase RtcB (3'-phosphate/5'-hydroxy nucleic acid ligase)